jgi:tetratricopeptide (TPR) repeat protein
MEFLKKAIISVVILAFPFVLSAQYSEKALKAFEQSYAHEKTRDYHKSVKILKDNYMADSYEFNLRLGWLTYNQGLFDDSKSYYGKAMALMPYSEEAKFGLILPLAARGEWDEVAKLYTQILTNNPGNTRALYNLGLIHYNRKEWSQAVRHFQKLVDLYPFDYDGLLMLAWTNLQLGKSREARVLFNKVLLYSPGDKSALEGMGLIK